ncbi:MAG: DUF1295 domain-containing protein [Hyphomicrobiaceae bacterium]|nr:DUF1295 domain-containing protein [Hyphomicrobiaceae bacterium]
MSLGFMAWTLLGQWLALAAVMGVAWLVQQRTGNSGWVDVAWTFGVGVAGAAGALAMSAGEAWTERQLLVAALVSLWALRLGSYIVGRSLHASDDPRYAELTKTWGEAAPRMMAGLLQAQAVASLPLVLAVTVAAQRPGAGVTWADLLGAALLAVAILGEGIADRQLAAFKADRANSGRVCDRGLWGWSRHPNYFFQWLGWLAYPVMAIDPSGSYAVGWLSLGAPVAMYWYLVHVSGIPPLEAHMLRSRPEAYRSYQARTSAFFPLPPATEPRLAR